MNEELQTYNKEIDNMKASIATETKKAEAVTQGKRDETELRLNQAKAELQEAEKERDGLKAQIQRLEAETNEAEMKGRAIRSNELARVDQKIANAQKQLQLNDERTRNALALFGSRMQEVLAEIDKARWHGQRPVGPLGKYVQAKDSRWAPVLRGRLGNAMSSFAVTDARDRPQLEQILKHYGK